jgi:hypothetical protein
MKVYKMMNKHELKQTLENGVVTVVFTKVDGTERTLKCTLLPEYMPSDVAPGQQLLTEASPRAENPNTISVWDIENNGWRSFRLDSVKTLLT